MAELALYRKYRPQTFDDVLGQESIVSILKASLEAGNIAHAYLFAGSRGTGKTSIARIFAREAGVKPSDLYEIDAASNRGIDDVRALREAVNTLPFESPYKCYIVDEVHMLTKEAFNALLKTLEEPPAHVLFILATTELDKLPETVISRCQVFAFKKPALPILAEMVIRVAQAEGVALERPAAELVALLGDGSFRDTHGMLQKALAGAEKGKLTLEKVESILGAPKAALVNDLVVALADKDLAKGLTAVNAGAEAGMDMKLYMRMVLDKLRYVLLLRFARDLVPRVQEAVTEEDFKLLEAIAVRRDTAINAAALANFLEAADLARFSPLPALPLELALIKILGDTADAQAA
jgi:DNA polymerase-3 subunit gamma/tau